MNKPDRTEILGIPSGVFPKHEYNSALYIQPLVRHQLFYTEGEFALHVLNGGCKRFSISETTAYSLTAMLEQKSVDELTLNYWRFTIGAFWRRQFDKKFPSFAFTKRDSRIAKNIIAAEAEMWVAAFQCLEAINTQGAWNFPSPATNLGLGLSCLVIEGLLIGWTVASSGVTNASGQALPEQQTINAKLKQRLNPFPENSLTHGFVETCLRLSEQNDEFDMRWRRLVKAKSGYLEIWRSTSPLVRSKKTGDILDRRARVRRKGKK